MIQQKLDLTYKIKLFERIKEIRFCLKDTLFHKSDKYFRLKEVLETILDRVVLATLKNHIQELKIIIVFGEYNRFALR